MDFSRKYDIIRDGVTAFTDLADFYGDKIDETSKAEDFFKNFMRVTGGKVILDFLDADNDDHIETVAFDQNEGIIKICTRIPEDDIVERTMRKMALPYDTYSLLGRLKNVSFVRVKDRKCIAIVVNCYTMNRKQIRTYVQSQGAEIKAHEEKGSFFTSDLICVKDGLTEYMRVLKTPISSFWIIPKGLHLSANDSEHYLYLYNVDVLEKRLRYTMEKLSSQLSKTKDKEETDWFIKMYGNMMRNVAEALFKLIMCFYHKKYDFEKKREEYNNRLLGDVIKPLKKYVYKDSADSEHFEVIIRVANELSHDSGLPVSIEDLGKLFAWLIYYVNDFKIRIDMRDNKQSLPLSKTKALPNEFVKSNLYSWDFSHLLKDVDRATVSKCAFLLKINPCNTSFEWDPQQEDFLCMDGKIHPLDEKNKANAMVIPNRKLLLEIEEGIYNEIKTKCEKEEFDTDFGFVEMSVEYLQCGNPSHLFTLDDIKTLMRKANDNVNNKLVIDEDGNAQIIQESSLGCLYPVSIETWCAGNEYVGADSTLSDAEPAYKLCLSLWLRFLQTGESQYDDYYVDIDVDKTVREIKKIYGDGHK